MRLRALLGFRGRGQRAPSRCGRCCGRIITTDPSRPECRDASRPGLRGTAAGGVRADPDGRGADGACAFETARWIRWPGGMQTLQVNQRALTNTVEQLAGFAPALLAVAARAPARWMPFVVAAGLVFGLARLVFWGGYLLGRWARRPAWRQASRSMSRRWLRRSRSGGRSVASNAPPSLRRVR